MLSWAYDFEADGICYDINEDETSVYVTERPGNNYSGDIVIPSAVTYNGIKYNVTGVGSNAFGLCGYLNEVVCYAEQVPETAADAFQYINMEQATLYVPASAIDAYKATAPWSGFGAFVGVEPAYILGDANNSGAVEIGDVTAVLTLLATPDATGYNNKAADANGNGEIEIGDVTTILTIMANGE